MRPHTPQNLPRLLCLHLISNAVHKSPPLVKSIKGYNFTALTIDNLITLATVRLTSIFGIFLPVSPALTVKCLQKSP
jgi:hypothetical protein